MKLKVVMLEWELMLRKVTNLAYRYLLNELARMKLAGVEVDTSAQMISLTVKMEHW